MIPWSFLCILLIVALIGNASANTVTRELTFVLPPEKEECFHETASAKDELEIDFQVIGGGTREDLFTDFTLLGPDGIPLIADFRRSEITHQVKAALDGDYKLCFIHKGPENGESKVIFFSVVVTSNNEDSDDTEEDELPDNHGTQDYMQYDMKTKDLEDALKGLRTHLSNSRHYQDQVRAHEYRDRSVAEHIFELVNFWSSIYFMALGMSSIFQVVMLRSLFDENSFLHGIWKQSC